MPKYEVRVEAMDYIEVEADNEQDALEQATEIARQQINWKAEITGESE